jgi:hypothetical protein
VSMPDTVPFPFLKYTVLRHAALSHVGGAGRLGLYAES